MFRRENGGYAFFFVEGSGRTSLCQLMMMIMLIFKGEEKEMGR